jgi:hypothetical protein
MAGNTPGISHFWPVHPGEQLQVLEAEQMPPFWQIVEQPTAEAAASALLAYKYVRPTISWTYNACRILTKTLPHSQ